MYSKMISDISKSIMSQYFYRYTINLKEISMKDQKDRNDEMIENWGGNWNLSFTLRAGSFNAQENGVSLNMIKLTGNIVAETLNEYFAHTSTTSTTTQLSNTTYPTPDTNNTNPTIQPTRVTPVMTSHIFGTRGAEIFMIILVLLFGAALIVLTIKYLQLRDKLKEEFKLNGLENVNPAYDNPMYGGHRSPERYNKIDSLPYYPRNNRNDRDNITI